MKTKRKKLSTGVYIVILLILLLIGSYLVVYRSLPESALYSFKVTTVEKVVSNFYSTPSAQISNEMTRLERRVQELSRMHARAEVTEGAAERIAADAVSHVDTIVETIAMNQGEFTNSEVLRMTHQAYVLVRAAEVLVQTNESLSVVQPQITSKRREMWSFVTRRTEELRVRDEITFFSQFNEELTTLLGLVPSLDDEVSSGVRLYISQSEAALAENDPVAAYTSLLNALTVIEIEQFISI